MKKIICPFFQFQGTVVTSKWMQDCIPSIHHLHFSCSETSTLITIAQFPTGSQAQHGTVSIVVSHCFQLCASRSQPCQISHITNVLIIEKHSSTATLVNTGCLQEGGTGLIELFQGFIRWSHCSLWLTRGGSLYRMILDSKRLVRVY